MISCNAVGVNSFEIVKKLQVSRKNVSELPSTSKKLSALPTRGTYCYNFPQRKAMISVPVNDRPSPVHMKRRGNVFCAMAGETTTVVQEEFSPCCPSECIQFAETLAERAGEVISKYFRVPIEIQQKMDKSPVTIADETVEEELRAMIRGRFPEHAILGEEGGLDLGSGSGEYTWVLDPIDGTASFITGKPLFGVLIALVHQGVPVLGILDQPILKERWIGIRNGENVSATHNRRPIKVRSCKKIEDSYLYTTSPHLYEGPSEIAFARLRKQVKRSNYGCDCYAFGLLSLGFVDIVIEHGMKPWDYLALVPIVEGAGGIFTDWEGRPLRLNSFKKEAWVGECLAAGDRVAHAEALGLLRWREPVE